MRRVGLGLVGLLLAGCSAAAGDNAADSVGSLGPRTPFGTVSLCLAHGNTHTRSTIGWETLSNAAATPVTVTSVTLTDPHHLTLASARLTVIHPGPGLLVGTAYGWHSRFNAQVVRHMAESVPAVGGSIPPHANKGDIVNLVLLLRTVTGGRSGPARVTYTDASGNSHTWVGGSAMVIKKRKPC